MRPACTRFASSGFVLVVGTAIACSTNGLVTYADAGPAANAGAGVGQPCSAAETCRSGLTCTAGVCAPCQCGAAGVPCTRCV